MKRFILDLEDVPCQQLLVDAPWILKEVVRQRTLEEAVPSALTAPEAAANKEADIVGQKLQQLNQRLRRGFELLLAKLP